MSEPHTGTFKIISLVDDNPATSITTYVPTSQTVRLNEALQIVWQFLVPVPNHAGFISFSVVENYAVLGFSADLLVRH